MKKSKIIALIIAVLMLTVTLTPAVSALDLSGVESLLGIIGGNNVDEEGVDNVLDSLFGGKGVLNLSDLLSGNGLDTIRSLLGGAADGTSDDALSSAIASLFGGNSALTSDFLNGDFLAQLNAILAGEAPTAPPTTEAPSTEPPTTEEPATEPPTEEPATYPPVTEPPTTYQFVPPTTVYGGSVTYPTDMFTTTTMPYETSTYQYVPVVSETVTQLVPSSFTPVVYDNEDGGVDEGVSAKMIIGIIILVISGGAVVAVALVLKKNRV